METKHEKWKRKPHFTGRQGNGLGNESHTKKETKQCYATIKMSLLFLQKPQQQTTQIKTKPMPKLKNQLYEDFAQGMAKGKSPTEILRMLCPDVKNPKTLGSRLWNRRDIRKRISEISAEAADMREMIIQQKCELLYKQALGIKPTKVVVSSKGQEEIFDMLGAIALDCRIARQFSTGGKQSVGELRLMFKSKNRNEECPVN
jgi:hypothetical protein